MALNDDSSYKSRFRLITETSCDAIISIDSNHTVLSWNRAAEKILGYSEDEIIGQKITLIIPNRFKGMHLTGVDRYLKTGVPKVMGKPVEVVALRKDGVEIPVELTLSTWQKNDKHFFAGIIRDISERKAAEARMKNILETSNDAIISINSNHTILSWNLAAERITGYSVGEIIGKKITVIIPDRFKELHMQGVSNYILTETPRIMGRPVEVAAIKKDGSEIPIEMTLAGWKEGKQHFFSAVIRDITERKNAEKIIQTKNLQLEEKQQEITDSINYAKRIQSAILPRVEDIAAYFSAYFVLYKPKDIISGDFYWFHRSNNYAYIAAADCTGHGVPGALTSMICSEKLNSALRRVFLPGEILTVVNRGVKTSLKHEETSADALLKVNDGMDIALCRFDMERQILEFSGANRPLWVIRKGASEITKFPPTKASIGGFSPVDQSFETHVVPLNSGDTAYLFTDGYADQDGGDRGRKLMSKNLANILLEIQHLNMEEQQGYLKKHIEEWISDREQRDDILIIGVRIP